MKKERKTESTQGWLPFKNFLDNGIIQLKDDYFVQLIKVNPINFNLKSNSEKTTILNSYKTLLKTCYFDFQIIIQSKKENIEEYIEKLQNNETKEPELSSIYQDYIYYLKNEVMERRSSYNRVFFIILKSDNGKQEAIALQELNDKSNKIRECLLNCGNTVETIKKDELIEILYSFLHLQVGE